MSAPSAAIRLNANAEAWVGPRKSTPQQQQTPQSSSTQNGGRPPSPFPSFPDTASQHHATPHRSSLNTSLSAVPVCRYFLSGGCDKGTACPYRHELSVEAPIGGGHVVFENNVANLLRGEDGVQTPPPQQKRMNGSPSPPPPPGYFSGPSPQDAATRSSSDKHIFISRHYHYQPAVPTHHQGDFHNPPPPHPMSAYQSPQHVPRMPSPPFGPAVPPAAVNTPPYSRTYARPGEVPLGYTARGFSSAALPPPLHNAPPPPPHHHQGLIFDGVRAAVLRKAHAAASSAERAHFPYENAHATTARAPGAWHHPSPPLAGMPAPPPNERLPVTSGGALLFDGTRDGASVHNVAHRGTAAESQGHPNFARSGGASAPTRSKLQTSMSIRSVTVAVEADSVSLGPSSTSTVGVPPVASDSFDLPPPLSAPVIPAPTSTDEDDDDRHSTTSADDLQRLQQLRAMLEHLA